MRKTKQYLDRSSIAARLSPLQQLYAFVFKWFFFQTPLFRAPSMWVFCRWLSAIVVLTVGILLARSITVPNSVTIDVYAPQHADMYQLFYDIGNGFNGRDSFAAQVFPSDTISTVTFASVPFRHIRRFRIDPGTREGEISIESITVLYQLPIIRIEIPLMEWSGNSLVENFTPLRHIGNFAMKGDLLTLASLGNDPGFRYSGVMDHVYDAGIPLRRYLYTVSLLAALLVFSFYKKIIAICDTKLFSVMPWRYALGFSVGAIIFINFLFFYGHYSGWLIFPWDFLSSAYHAQTVAWFRDGSMFSPPRWFPYGSMGFPACWSIQSGAWYIPIQVLSWLKIEYTLNVAAAFQSAHVAIGALGVVLLARTHKLSWTAATLAGVGYHFGSLFYSNQQHVDMVRAAALLPFVLNAFHPKMIVDRPLAILWAGIILWQYLVASYPGAIVAGGYTVGLAALAWCFSLPRKKCVKYLGCIIGVATAALLMSMLKWAPTINMYGAISVQRTVSVFALHSRLLLTTFFRYNLEVLGRNDPTMQSIWLPPLVFVFGIFLKKREGSSAALPLIMIALLAYLAPQRAAIFSAIREFMPGMCVSRMQHSDWRPPLHIALSLLGAMTWESVCRERIKWRPIVLRSMLVLTVFLLVCCVAIFIGYKPNEIIPDATALILLILSVGWSMSCRTLMHRRRVSFVLAFVYCVVAAYMQYISHVPATWRNEWSKETEQKLFHEPLKSLLSQEHQSVWNRRPARVNYGVGFDKDEARNVRYNRAWYAREFAAFGYDNIRTPENIEFVEAIQQSIDGDALLGFMQSPSRAILLPIGEDFDPQSATNTRETQYAVSMVPDSQAQMLRFGLDGATIEINAREDLKLVENEMWYKGWQGVLRDRAGNRHVIESYPDYASLRAWSIPKGTWVLTTEYHTPARRISYLMFILGLSILLMVFLLLRNTAPPKEFDVSMEPCK